MRIAASLLCLVLWSTVCEGREWTDSTGQYKIEAEFAGAINNIVRLRKPDGVVVEIPIERLSQEDQDLVRGLSHTTANSKPTAQQPALSEQAKKIINQLTSRDRPLRVKAVLALEAQPQIPEQAIDPLLEFSKLEFQQAFISPRQGAGDTVPRTSIPLVGDETPIVRIRANPRDYIGKVFTICGTVEVSNYWNFKYADAKDTHYSLRFHELDKNAKRLGYQAVNLYVVRGAPLAVVERFVKAEERGAQEVIVRVKATILPKRFKDAANWEFLELCDLQFLSQDGKTWEPFLHEGVNSAARCLARLGRPAIPKLAELMFPPKLDDVAHYGRILVLVAGVRMDAKCRKLLLLHLRRHERLQKTDKLDYDQSQKERAWRFQAFMAFTSPEMYFIMYGGD